MACDKPNGDCTDVTPCLNNSGCGCSESNPPVLPRCQDIFLAKGVYKNPTITVNDVGCISEIKPGDPAIYIPNDCCDGSGGSSGGAAGARGPKGDPGAAATVTVEQAIVTGTNPYWSVENVGTPSAATFRFTAPNISGGGGGLTPTGATGTAGGLKVENGIVKTLPAALVEGLSARVAGTYAQLVTLTAAPVSATAPNEYVISLNIDSLVAALRKEFTDSDAVLYDRISALEQEVVKLNNIIASNPVPYNGVIHHGASQFSNTAAVDTFITATSDTGAKQVIGLRAKSYRVNYAIDIPLGTTSWVTYTDANGYVIGGDFYSGSSGE